MKQFKGNLITQCKLALHTLGILRQYGVQDDNELKLEFFFYSKTKNKAELLATSLKGLSYEVEVGKSAGDESLFLINGWTTNMKLDDFTVQSWIKQMCRLGFKHDCQFDGWGTMVDQA